MVRAGCCPIPPLCHLPLSSSFSFPLSARHSSISCGGIVPHPNHAGRTPCVIPHLHTPTHAMTAHERMNTAARLQVIGNNHTYLHLYSAKELHVLSRHLILNYTVSCKKACLLVFDGLKIYNAVCNFLVRFPTII